MHELEEAEIKRQLVLRDAPVRAQPGAQQRPETLDRVDMDLAEPAPVLVAGILAAGVADRLVPVTPGEQASVDAILVRVDEGEVVPVLRLSCTLRGVVSVFEVHRCQSALNSFQVTASKSFQLVSLILVVFAYLPSTCSRPLR